MPPTGGTCSAANCGPGPDGEGHGGDGPVLQALEAGPAAGDR